MPFKCIPYYNARRNRFFFIFSVCKNCDSTKTSRVKLHEVEPYDLRIGLIALKRLQCDTWFSNLNAWSFFCF